MYQSRQRAFRPKAVLQKKRKAFWVHFGLISFDLLLWIFVLSFFTHFKPLQIAEINFSGNEAVGDYYLSQVISQETSGNFLWFFSKNNIVTFPKSKIESDILVQFPRVASVSVARQGLSSILVRIAERQPKFLWCDGVASELAVSSCYLMDETGRAFALAPVFSGQTYLKYFNGESGDLTNQLFKSNFNFQELAFFIDSLRGSGILVNKINSNQNGDLELYLEAGGKIIVGSGQTLGKTFDNLSSVWNDNDLNLKASTTKLDYIDLRFGNKVFYKER